MSDKGVATSRARKSAGEVCGANRAPRFAADRELAKLTRTWNRLHPPQRCDVCGEMARDLDAMWVRLGYRLQIYAHPVCALADVKKQSPGQTA